MGAFVVKLGGRQEQIVELFIHKGVFCNKTEVVRAGILELYTKYSSLLGEDKLMLAVAQKIEKGGSKAASEKEFLKKRKHLK